MQVINLIALGDTSGSGELEFSEFVLMLTGATTSLTAQIRGQLSEIREVPQEGVTKGAW